MTKPSSDHLADTRGPAKVPSDCRMVAPEVIEFQTNHNQIGRLILMVTGVLISFLIASNNALAFSNLAFVSVYDQDLEQVASLISRLDSRDYSQREQAAQTLIDIGEQAIRPLALKSFECSPEVCWRIRKILEQISTRGNETVFYKTTGILQLRFESSNAEMKKRLSLLESKWRVQRKKNAILALRKKGAVINDPFEGREEPTAPQQLGNNIFFGGGEHMVVINGRVVELSSSENGKTQNTPKRTPRKQLSDSDAKQEIERILNSDLKQARQIVIGDEKADSESVDKPDQNIVQIQRQMLAGRHFLGAPTIAAGSGVTLELGERWKGNAADLETLTELSTDMSKLTEVKLTSQSLDAASLQRLASLKTINKLVIENCAITAKEIQNIKWSKSLREIELAKLDLSDDFLASFEAVPSLNLLSFRECDFELGSNFDSLIQLKSLRGLQFKGLDISKELFESFAKMKQLSFINLSYCKFKTTDYKALKSLRPNLQISFTAKAFLGVRGPTDLAQTGRGIGGCVVSEVIAGSGAQKGGIKINDIIETVNGEKVQVFEDLRLHIAQHRPGEELNVTVKRAGKPLNLTIKLSSFDQAQP